MLNVNGARSRVIPSRKVQTRSGITCKVQRSSNGSIAKSDSSLYTIRSSDFPNFLNCKFNRACFHIALKSVNTTRHIQYSMDPIKPNMRIFFQNRYNNMNIGAEIKYEYQGSYTNSEDTIDLGDVYLNTSAFLIIDKRRKGRRTYQKELADSLMYHMTVSRVDESKFLLDPFVRDVGILIPQEVAHENADRITLRTHAVFPSTYLENNIDPIKKRINRLNNVFHKEM